MSFVRSLYLLLALWEANTNLVNSQVVPERRGLTSMSLVHRAGFGSLFRRLLRSLSLPPCVSLFSSVAAKDFMCVKPVFVTLCLSLCSRARSQRTREKKEGFSSFEDGCMFITLARVLMENQTALTADRMEL